MPLIELWKGIKFKMYFKDHNPPHFHALHQDSEAIFNIETGELLNGKLPHRIHKKVIEWWKINRERLKDEWERLSHD